MLAELDEMEENAERPPTADGSNGAPQVCVRVCVCVTRCVCVGAYECVWRKPSAHLPPTGKTARRRYVCAWG